MTRPYSAFALTFAALLGRPAICLLSGEDNRVAMDTRAWPYCAIGRVQCKSVYGTGTLVSPDTVLTAAHLLVNPRTGQVDPSELQSFDIGVAGGRPQASSRIASVIFGSKTPSRTYQERDQDWALLTLERKDFGQNFGWIRIQETSSESLPRQLIGIGYSKDFHNGLTAGIDRSVVIEHRFPGFSQVFVAMDEDIGASGGPVLIEGQRANGKRDTRLVGIILGAVSAAEPKEFAGKQFTLVIASKAFGTATRDLPR